MITVTEDAKEHLATALDAASEDAQDDACFRIVRSENDQLTMVLGQRAESDSVIERDGKPLVAVDESVEPIVDGRTLDVRKNDQGQPVLTLE